MLLCSYACKPGEGSEAGVGWATLLASLNFAEDVYVLTKNKNKERIFHSLSQEQRQRIHFVDVRQPVLYSFRKKTGRLIPYLLWIISARFSVSKLCKVVKFDLAHHSTYSSIWMPTPFSREKLLIQTLGPVGGLEGTPKTLRKFLGIRGFLMDFVRRAAGPILRNVFGGLAHKNVSVIIRQNPQVKLPSSYKGQVVDYPNVALELSGLPPWRGNQSSTFVGAGRLIPWKGWRLLRDSFERIDTKYKLILIGEGSDRNALERYIERKQLSARVKFLGEVSRANLLDALAECRAVCVPSFHEAAGWIAAEAVSIGSPVVGLNQFGVGNILKMSHLTSVQTAASATEIIEAFADAMNNPTRPTKTDVFSIQHYSLNLAKTWSSALGLE